MTGPHPKQLPRKQDSFTGVCDNVGCLLSTAHRHVSITYPEVRHCPSFSIISVIVSSKDLLLSKVVSNCIIKNSASGIPGKEFKKAFAKGNRGQRKKKARPRSRHQMKSRTTSEVIHLSGKDSCLWTHSCYFLAFRRLSPCTFSKINHLSHSPTLLRQSETFVAQNG